MYVYLNADTTRRKFSLGQEPSTDTENEENDTAREDGSQMASSEGNATDEAEEMVESASEAEI
jgi:hypothetical protein